LSERKKSFDKKRIRSIYSRRTSYIKALVGTINKSIFINLPDLLIYSLKRLGHYRILFLKGRILSSSISLINRLSTSSSNIYILYKSIKTRTISALREYYYIPNSSL
jgi:hypothetical protein